MPSIEKLVATFQKNQRGVRFADALRVCIHFFGSPRTNGSHYVFKTTWKGDPRINIQNRQGYVAEYQVKQIVAAVTKWKEEHSD